MKTHLGISSLLELKPAAPDPLVAGGKCSNSRLFLLEGGCFFDSIFFFFAQTATHTSLSIDEHSPKVLHLKGVA